MKANSRRRVLISSMCMLLVALVALSTATFAWFSSNKSVTADGMTVKAAAAKGLQITGQNGTKDSDDFWGPSYSFTAANTVLMPVSVPYSTDADTYATFSKAYYPENVTKTGAWESTNANGIDGWKDNATFPSAAATGEAFGSNGYFAVYEVGVRSTGDDISGVKMNVNYSGAKASDYIRVAVLDQATDATNIIGDAENDIDADEIITVIGSETGANAITSTTPSTAAQKLEAGGVDIAVDDVTSTPKYYTVLVWFEGQDAQCIDTNQAAEGEVTINFHYGTN